MTTSAQGTEVHVPSRLARPHQFVATTRNAARGARTDEQGRLQLGGAEGVARVTVSRPQFRRALLILQGLFAEAERRSFVVRVAKYPWSTRSCVAIVIRGHVYPVGISEMMDRVPMTEPELERWRSENKWRLSYAAQPTNKSVVNGRLKLTLPRHHDGRQSNWTEGPRGKLEGKLAAVLTELESRAEADDRIAAERARAEEERQRRVGERLERERLARIEEARAKRLAAEVTSWHHAHEIREFVDALRKRIVELPDDERDRLEQWCEWAEARADLIDPILSPSNIRGLDDRPGRGPWIGEMTSGGSTPSTEGWTLAPSIDSRIPAP